MPQNTDLKNLDELVASLGGDDIGSQSAGSCRLLMEHLQAARRGLLGSMLAEYASSLKFAKDSISCISDRNARDKTQTVLQGLIDHMSSSDQRRSAEGEIHV